MEKNPAACAMDWSIQLEKSLRSPKPGKSIEAVEEIGVRLEWWDREPELTFAEYKMFGLIPGEDKLFLNAIFLRLADAFRLGNKQIKNAVVKLFLRMKKRKKRVGEGILSKGKLENCLEFLSRVKEVFDKGDDEERTMALVLFGCWAYFSKDCLDIRYIVLSSLVSDGVFEVKAALFAAGCMSELSDDFASVFLEILATIALSSDISRSIKLAGGQVFSKICCSFSVANKAYKTGLKLLMDSSEDDFSAVMLISLSRIASRWTLLIPTQIELLKLFLSEERSVHLQVTSLRCHSFVLARGVCNLPSSTDTVNKLFGTLQSSELQPTLQIEAFRILHKILLFNLAIIPCMEIPALLQKLLVVVKNMLQSSIVSTRGLAISVLADISGKVLGRVDMVSGGTGGSLASEVISFVLDQILLLVMSKVDIYQHDLVSELEVKNLLRTLFNLVEKHSYLRCLVLNNVCLFIDKLMKMLNKVIDTEKTGLSNHVRGLVESKLMLYVSKILVACLQNFEEADMKTTQVLDALKLRAENICHSIYFDTYIRMTYFLLLHEHSTFMYMWHMTEKLTSQSRISSLPCINSILQFDKFSQDYAKKTSSYWCSYKAGKIAACQGAWSTAAFIFEQLMTVVQSASCSCWLKSLAQFSTSEKNIQFLLCEQGDIALGTNYCSYTENLLRACSNLLSAEETLTASDIGHIFSFQRWFLTLRTKFLKTVGDMMKLIDTIRDGTGPSRQQERGILLPCTTSPTLDSLICSSMEISCQMKNLARELDLLLTSFIGMGRQSVMMVSALALSCSLMAFTAGFAFLIPYLHSSENYRTTTSGNSEEPLHALLIEDLLGRLRHTDTEIRRNLIFLLKKFHSYRGCSLPRFTTQKCYISYEAIVLHKLCEYSVGEILNLQNGAPRLQRDDDIISQIVSNGSLLLFNTISNLMIIPFRTPHYFFRVRPAISSELFVMNEDGQIVDGSSIMSGSLLSLNLCLQLKNMPAGLPGQLKKAYCILNCKTHSPITIEAGEGKGHNQFFRQDHEIGDLLDLNEKLLRYVKASVEIHGQRCASEEKDCLMVNAYVCFELNERGQGFSTCLLDVSSFPVGSYRLKWHSGCIDSEGSYWSLLAVNAGPSFTVRDAPSLH